MYPLNSNRLRTDLMYMLIGAIGKGVGKSMHTFLVLDIWQNRYMDVANNGRPALKLLSLLYV